MEESKIYVVIAVLSIILIGIAIYLFVLEKKIKSVEKKMDELKTNQKETS